MKRIPSWAWWVGGVALLWWFRYEWAPLVGLTPTQGFPGLAKGGEAPGKLPGGTKPSKIPTETARKVATYLKR